MSQQIKALEEELEVRLFHRKPRGVELTDAGEALLPDARRILADVEAALLRVRRTARGEQGRIAVGFTSSVPFHPFVPEALRDYRESHPLVSMPLEEGGTADLVAAIAAERLDVAFIRSPASDAEGIAVYELLNEPMVVALPAAQAGTTQEAGADPARGACRRTFRSLSARVGARPVRRNYGRLSRGGVYAAS